MARARIPDANEEKQRVLFGPMDRHLRAVRERYGVRISVRNSVLTLEGDNADTVDEVVRRVKRVIGSVRPNFEPPTDVVEDMLLGPDGDAPAPRRKRGAPPQDRSSGSGRPPGPDRAGVPDRAPLRTGPRSQPRPKTPGQEVYIEAIRSRDVVFGVGPAGTGKTFLAVVEAVNALRANAVRKIILTRPAVEAGEKLGFLPGDFHAKINPYLRPLYDALGEMLAYGEVQRYIAADIIEIVPLAYMRGRTLKDAFIILDEAQNTTPAQMKMFMTRMGEGSKIVVTGDVTQIDLPAGNRSGLIESVRILEPVDGISVVRFGARDILRHPLVQRIVDAYETETERELHPESRPVESATAEPSAPNPTTQDAAEPDGDTPSAADEA